MMKRHINWQSIAILLTVLLGICMFVWYAATTQTEDLRFDNEKVYPVGGEWKAEISGEERTVTLPVNVKADAGEKVVFRRVLEEQPTICNTILFHSSHQYVKVYLDDQLLLDYGTNQKTPVKMSPGSPWQCVRLPDDWAGRELIIETIAVYDNSAGYMEQVYTGSKNSLVFKVMKDAALSVILTIPVLLIGICMVITSFFFHEVQAVRRMRTIGAFALVTSIWILLESRITQMFTGRTLVCMNLIFILFGLIPVFFLYYLLTYEIFRKSRYMRVVFLISAVNYAAIQILRFLGLVDYMDSVSWVHAVLALVLAGILGIYIRERIHKRQLEEECKSLFGAALVLAGFGAVDVLRFYMMWLQSDAVMFTKIGLFCFALILGYAAVRQEARNNTQRIEQKMLEKLAYTDMLTGLKNRTAFEKKMEEYRKGKESQPILMITDMNDLKHINDTYGHSMGDAAIIRVARTLEKYFKKTGDCFRIGGDEFCVIADGMAEEEFVTLVDTYMEEIGLQFVASECVLSTASGYVKCGSDGIDKAFTEADKRMYQCKAAIKNKAAGRSMDK